MTSDWREGANVATSADSMIGGLGGGLVGPAAAAADADAGEVAARGAESSSVPRLTGCTKDDF